MTSRLASALDNGKVSDGSAGHILIAGIEALGLRAEDYAVNRSTIHRFRHQNQLKESKEIEFGFADNVI